MALLLLVPCAMAQEGTAGEVAEAVAEVVEPVAAPAGVLARYSSSVSLIIDGLVRILLSPVSCTLKLCLTMPCSLFSMCLTVPCSLLQGCLSILSCCPCCGPCFTCCGDVCNSVSDVCCGDVCQSISDSAAGMVKPLADILAGLAGDAVRGLLKLPAPA